jgi:hypothetical protein
MAFPLLSRCVVKKIHTWNASRACGATLLYRGTAPWTHLQSLDSRGNAVFSADGRSIEAADMKLWDAENGACLMQFDIGPRDHIFHDDFSHDGFVFAVHDDFSPTSRDHIFHDDFLLLPLLLLFEVTF